PRSNADVSLDALRTRRLRLGQLALRDAIGPVAEILIGSATELAGDAVGHLLARLAGLQPAHPRILAVNVAELCRNGASRLVAKLVAADAVDVVHLPQPVLSRDVLRDRGGPVEILGRRNLEERIP